MCENDFFEAVPRKWIELKQTRQPQDRKQIIHAKNHIVRTKVQQMRQESQKLLESMYFAYLCGNGFFETIARKWTQWSGFEHRQEHNETTQNNHAKHGAVQHETRKMILETAKLHETSWLSYLCSYIEFEQEPRKWSGFEYRQDHNETIQNTHAKHGAVRNETRKMIHETAKMHESMYFAYLCGNDSVKLLHKIGHNGQDLNITNSTIKRFRTTMQKMVQCEIKRGK